MIGGADEYRWIVDSLEIVARICQPTTPVAAGTVNLVAVDMAKAVYYQVDREHYALAQRARRRPDRVGRM